ncbi:MAG TPA: serine/threonine-protein kinase [Gemmatimonadaceae bacterium]|nr:serine/threonine-protein kinase [Gemmatimonadaceae bacterium]
MESTASQISLSSLQTALSGRYALERELGRGGMATVYLARDLEHDRHVAVKVLLPELAVTLGVERFLREIEVGTVLQHPHIVGVLDSGQTDGILYYTMPFVDGASLRDRLDREKQLPIDDAISIARQVAEALAYAHSQGVVHRDIKPENILLNKDGAMVADFGIARAVSVAGGETLTRTGMAVGTPTYMSPEQAMASREVTAESDIYSLACVMYEMLAGQPPFSGPTAMALLARHSLDNVPSLKIVRGTVPDAVEDAIVRAMAKVPADRFHSATDFAAALTDHEGAARRRQESLAAQAIAANTVQQMVPRARRRKTLAIAAAIAVPLLAAGGWFGWQTTHAAPAAPTGLTGEFAKSSIAVMYFQDRSPGKKLDYLADGLTEALIDELSAVKQLKVISQNGSAAFKGKDAIPTDSIARALKIGTLVNGVVEPMAGDSVRVTVRLVDALSGKQLDKTEVDAALQSSLGLKDTIAAQLSIFLRKRVGLEIQELVSHVGTKNAAAWEAMQHARETEAEIDALVKAGDVPAALAKAAATDSALAKVESLDPNWTTPIVARSWLGFKASRLLEPSSPDFTRWIDGGLANAERALKKSPSDAGALEARGTLHYWQWLNNLAPNPAASTALFASAEKDLRAATVANDHSATAWNYLSHLLINKGDLAEAKLDAENAYRTDPYLVDVDKTILRLFFASLDMNAPTEAAKWCNEGRSRFPQNYLFTECKLWLYALPMGTPPDMRDVWATYDEYVKVSPSNVQEFDKLKGKMIVALALVRAGMKDSAEAMAAANQGDAQIDPGGELTNLAINVYAQSGNKDKALDLIARFLATNPQQRESAANDKSWWLKDLRSDPRYQALVKKPE